MKYSQKKIISVFIGFIDPSDSFTNAVAMNLHFFFTNMNVVKYLLHYLFSFTVHVHMF